jgi:galactokinase
VALRFNVVNGRTTTATAVVGEPGGKIASLGQGGTVEVLADVLANLQDEQGHPVAVTPAAWEALRLRAQEAARRADIGIVGVDMVLETGDAGVQGIIVELNARPGILVMGETVVFPEDGPVESHPAPVADTHFWSSLSLPGRQWSPAGESLRRMLVVCDDPVVREQILTTMARRHPWVHVESINTLAQAVEYLRGVQNGDNPLPDLIFERASGSGRVVGPGSDVWFEYLNLQARLDIPSAGGMPVGEGDLDGLVSYMRGMTETFTLSEWQQILADPVRSGFRSALSRFVAVDRLNEEIERVRNLVAEAAGRTVQLGDKAAEPLFRPDARIALSFAPGRVRFFMGHSDIRGIGGQTINAATHYGMWALTQVVEDATGRVVSDNLDTTYSAFEFNLNDPNVLPPPGINSVRPDWMAWAEAHEDKFKWQGLLKAVPALVRTDMMDPTGQRREWFNGKGIRFLLSESNLPTGKGLSSSSSLPAVFYRGIQQFLPAELRLRGKGLNDMDYVAYVAGDRAGTADMTAINLGNVNEVSVLESFPERQGEAVRLPADFRFFVIDSGVKRLDDPSQPPDTKNFAAFVKSMTGMGPSMASIWLRHVSRTQPTLAKLEPLLISDPAGQPFGLLRELTELGALKQAEYTDMVGGPTAEARKTFAQWVLEQIPNDLTLGQLREQITEPDLQAQFDALFAGFVPLNAHKIPAEALDKDEQLKQLRLNTVIPLRHMAAYGLLEIQRGLDYVAAAKKGRTEDLIRLMREAQDGDRALWALGPDGTLVPTAWGAGDVKEAFYRSTPEVDTLVDQFQADMEAEFGTNSAAGRIMAAGLGGAVAVGVKVEAYEAAKRWFASYDGGREVIDVAPGGGATGVSVRAGLEQTPVMEASSLLVEKAALPSATAAISAVGVVAGTADPKGLAYGVALTRVSASDGMPLPVAFVVETAQQKATLERMGVSGNAIFLAGTAEYPTAAEAVTAANSWLGGVYGVGQVVDVGATRPIGRTIEQILSAVFGITISPETVALWDSFIDRATLALQA